MKIGAPFFRNGGKGLFLWLAILHSKSLVGAASSATQAQCDFGEKGKER